MKKKPKTKSKAVRNLPAKGLAAKASKGVKGGFYSAMSRHRRATRAPGTNGESITTRLTPSTRHRIRASAVLLHQFARSGKRRRGARGGALRERYQHNAKIGKAIPLRVLVDRSSVV